MTLDVDGQALARLLADLRGPARSRTTASRSTATGNIVLAYTPEQRGGAPAADREAEEPAASTIGCHEHLIPRNLFVGQRIPLAGVAHQNGTIRFGDDPRDLGARPSTARRTSVDNLYVVDGSFFPSSGAVNPALTIMANALRVGDHLLRAAGAERRGAGRCARSRARARRRSRWRSRSPPARRTRRRCVARGRRGRHDRRPTWTARSPSSPACSTFDRGLASVEVAGDAIRAARRASSARARGSPACGSAPRSIELTEYLAPRGRPLPADSRSNDRWFQHVAIVVARHGPRPTRACAPHGVEHASTGPQTLPDWNPDAGGIRAFYFRDPDGHVLELICVPAGQGRPALAGARTRAVPRHRPHRDRRRRHRRAACASTATRSACAVAGESENYGPEQEHLNNVFGARLRITALRARRRARRSSSSSTSRPRDGRPAPADLARQRPRALADDARRRGSRRPGARAGRR